MFQYSEQGKFLSIEDTINKYLDELWDALGNVQKPDPQDEMDSILVLLKEKHPLAQESLSKISQVLAVGLTNLIYSFNPEKIILGGWMGIYLFDYLFPEIYKNLQIFCMAATLDKTVFCPSKFSVGESCIGASCLALDGYLNP